MTCLLALLLLLPQAPKYVATELESPADEPTVSQPFLLDDGTIAANWYTWVGPGHGASMVAKPFVWDGTRFVQLPMSKSEYGHVVHGQTIGGRGPVLVGELWTKDGDRPVTWEKHPSRGWRDAKLTVLDTKPSRAVWIEKSGRVWFSTLDSWKDGKVTRGKPVENFDLFGVGPDGKLYGNKYGSIGVGFMRMNERAGYFMNGKWTALFDPGESSISAVGESGVVVGEHGPTAFMWKDGKKTALPGSWANGVSSAGHVVATRSTQPWSVFVWHQGQTVELNAYVKGLAFAGGINAKGQVLAWSDEHTDSTIHSRLYLLSPVVRP